MAREPEGVVHLKVVYNNGTPDFDAPMIQEQVTAFLEAQRWSIIKAIVIGDTGTQYVWNEPNKRWVMEINSDWKP